MAKQRKQKQKEHRASDVGVVKADEGVASCCTTVLHQKLCVAIDVAAQRIYGHTELKVPVKQGGKIGGVIGLHARGLHIEQVLVDGVEAQFEIDEFHANIQPPQNSKSLVEAADDAYRKYSEDLYLEMQPELLIHPPASSTPAGEEPKDPQEGKLEAGLIDGYSQSGPIVKPETTNVAAVPGSQAGEVRIVRVEYWVEKPASGAHFGSDILHTHNQLRRARCWFPCVDSNLQRCSFDLEFTVNSEYVAVSNGKLLYQVYSNLGTHLKTYVYSLAIPITASSVSLVVAPLVVLPDRHHPTVSHLCLPGLDSTLHSSISFFHTVFGLYEEYLGASFPFGCYKQVFIPGNAAISTTSIGASLAIISGDLLSDEHIIDQAIGTRIKLAHALAQQWFGVFITPDSPADDWLLEGLAGMLTDLFVKRFLGNNEARFRRYKANEAVCLVEVDGAPVLSPPAGLDMDMYGTEKLGVLGKIRSWKATAVVQMLEKQMGPEPFRKVLQRIIMRAQDPNRQIRTLSTTEFRHFANKLGNLERPFLKDFFPRWVESSGCPRLRMGFVYSKRRNMVELAVRRDSTAMPKVVGVSGKAETPGAKLRASDMGWPGMMSIRLHELDGMYDHPSLPMAGDHYQLLELQCHSKLAGRRIQRPKKGAKGDALEENADATPAQSLESPLLWLRGDPELEYLAELNLIQPEHMWINQLEKDRDVIGQVQAVAALRAHSRTSFALVNALNNCLVDPKVFCRVRIEAAAALASTASEGTSYVGLQNLIKYYKSHRFDPDIGLPKPNDFHDFAEYFVLESIPGAVAEVRGNDGKSPLEAADFILHILKHNDNNGNTYSDVYWLASVIESIGSLEFGQQNLKILARMLKQIDRFLQYDRLMPSYNGVVTISCIHTLTKLAIRFSQALPLDRITQLLKTFKDAKIIRWQVRVAALRALLELEFHSKGLEAAAVLALQHISDDPSFAVQSKVMKHVVQLGTITEKGSTKIGGLTIAQLLGLLECSKAFHNVGLRHYIFCFLQVLAGRSASLYRSAECLAKLAPSQPSQDKRFVKTKNSFKVRLRATQAPAPTPSSAPVPSPYTKLVVKLKPPVIAERTESGNSGGRRELDEQKGRLVFKLKLPSSSSAQEGPGEDASQALEVSTGAVPMDCVVASSPTSVKQEVNFHEFIDSNPFTQNDTSQVDVLDMHQEEMRGPITETQEAGLEEITQDEGMEENHEGIFEDTEGDASPKASHQGRVGPGSDSDQATMEQEPTFDLNGEDTQDGMGMEMRDRLTKESAFAGATDPDLQRYNSLSGVAGTESTQDGGGEETESQKREEKHKKERKHEKKDKKDRKEKKKKKHDKHNDPEYLEKKRKRKEEKEHRHRQEGHKSVKEDKPRKEERQAVKVEGKAFSGLPVTESIKTEGDTKLKVVFKKRRTIS